MLKETINERDHKFVKELGEVYRTVWREEREGEIEIQLKYNLKNKQKGFLERKKLLPFKT